MKLLLTVLAIIYALMPYDLMPDVFAGIGWLDDILVFSLLWRFFYSTAARRKADAQRRQHESRSSGRADNHTDHASPEQDPYRILGLAPGASVDEIKKAYRELAVKYHPDKVAHLGEEFKSMAEQRFKQIQEAYQTLTDQRR